MLNFLFNKIYDLNPPAIAFDLSDLSLKFIQLEKKRKKIILKNFGEYKIPKGVIDKGQIIKKDELIFIFKDIIKNNSFFRSNFIVCNFPEQHSFIKIIKMPKVENDKLKEAVGWQIEEVIPFKFEEIYYDAQVLNYNEGINDHIDVLIAAAKKDLIDDYILFFKEIGLRLKKLEPESIAISRAVVRDSLEKSTLLIIDWGATQITFILYSNGAPIFTNSMQIEKPYFLTEAIAQKFNISFDEAEAMKYEIGLNKHIKLSKYILEAIEPILKNLILQIQKSLSYYEDYAHKHLKDYKVSEIILCGGEANLYGLTNYLHSELGLSVKRANPLIKILKSPFQQSKEMSFNTSLKYATVIGLGLSEVMDYNL